MYTQSPCSVLENAYGNQSQTPVKREESKEEEGRGNVLLLCMIPMILVVEIIGLGYHENTGYTSTNPRLLLFLRTLP